MVCLSRSSNTLRIIYSYRFMNVKENLITLQLMTVCIIRLKDMIHKIATMGMNVARDGLGTTY